MEQKEPTSEHGRIAAEREAGRAEIIAQVDRELRDPERRAWLIAWRMYQSGLTSVYAYHKNGSLNVLRKGWYCLPFEQEGYVPVRVWSLGEAMSIYPADDADELREIYRDRMRIFTVFTERTGPSGQVECAHLDSPEAHTMTENPISEQSAIRELEYFGFSRADLPSRVFLEYARDASYRLRHRKS